MADTTPTDDPRTPPEKPAELQQSQQQDGPPPDDKAAQEQKVNLEDNAAPTKPNVVQGENVNRA
jgi:hypothetical protein